MHLVAHSIVDMLNLLSRNGLSRLPWRSDRPDCGAICDPDSMPMVEDLLTFAPMFERLNAGGGKEIALIGMIVVKHQTDGP